MRAPDRLTASSSGINDLQSSRGRSCRCMELHAAATSPASRVRETSSTGMLTSNFRVRVDFIICKTTLLGSNATFFDREPLIRPLQNQSCDRRRAEGTGANAGFQQPKVWKAADNPARDVFLARRLSRSVFLLLNTMSQATHVQRQAYSESSIEGRRCSKIARPILLSASLI